jgi:DNA invertase Pin-like site-specific DNA recombinase
MSIEISPMIPTTAQRAKMAYVYIRQSSLMQVTRHAESTDLQYSLVERAIALGWPRERVEIIDEDLGKSGAQAEARGGFQRLLAEISLASVGLVLSFDASRLARNNHDWYQLLEVCSIFGTLIADGERLYDPRLYHDRLLLGLSGMMSEAELHHLKQRMHAGARHQAERGELRQGLPVGLARGLGGEVILNPDEEVQARIRLVFEKFREIHSAGGVMRYLQETRLPLPARPRHGPAPRRGSSGNLQALLPSSIFFTIQPRLGPMSMGVGHAPLHIHAGDGFSIPLTSGIFAYTIGIQRTFLGRNLSRIRLNYARIVCAIERSGLEWHAKAKHYCKGSYVVGVVEPSYGCTTQVHKESFPSIGAAPTRASLGEQTESRVRAIALDAQIEQRFLEALRPDQLTLALAALAQMEQEEHAAHKQWELRLERARYQAKRAERKSQAVEPENRLVARSLEKQWEEQLRAVEAVEKEYQVWNSTRLLALTQADREAILALGSDLPALWQAPTTTNAERKQMLRLVIREVIVDSKRVGGQVWVQINWQTGAHDQFCYKRSVRSYAVLDDVQALEQRVRDLNAAGLMDAQIAAVRTAEGYQTPQLAHPITSKMVWHLREKWSIPTVKLNGKERNPPQWADGSYSVEGAAARLGVDPSTIFTWLKTGRLRGEQLAKKMPWKVYLTEEDIPRLHEWLRRARRSKREAL